MNGSTELRPITYALADRAARLIGRHPRLEDLSLVLISLFASVYMMRGVLFGRYVYDGDTRLHEYWMRRFQDPELFQDPLTEALLRAGYMPDGFRAFYWLGSWVIDPVRLSELLPLVVAPLSAWLVFRIVRLHTSWWPAAWLGASLFLLPWDLHRLTGGHQRAFAPLIILPTVYFLLRRRDVAAALVAPIGALFYPSAALGALGIIALSSLDLGRRPRIDRWRAGMATLSTGVVALALLLPPLLRDSFPEVITRAQAHEYPDFGPHGRVPFFADSTLTYLSQKLSGFGLFWSGSILVLVALACLLIRPRNVFLPRREVSAMPIVALALFGLAHAVLFRLYLPHRYAYPLVPYLAIFIALSWRPTWEVLAARRTKPWLLALAGVAALSALGLVALAWFPLGLRFPLDEALSTIGDKGWKLGAALAFGVLVAALFARGRPQWLVPAVVAGALLIGGVAVAGGDSDPGVPCGKRIGLLRYLGTLPKDTVIAGNPPLLDCVPLISQRAVVINKKLYQVWEVNYWRFGRRRTFDAVRAYYGGSMQRILDQRERYGADYYVVERGPFWLGAWRGNAPFTQLVRRLSEAVEVPAVRRLPRECVTWRGNRHLVYDLACVAGRVGPSESPA